MAIYTKKGDEGKTSLYVSKRVSKNSLRIEAIGAVDELNSYLGIVVSETKKKKLFLILTSLQKDLFTIGAMLAGKKLKLSLNKVREMEKEIDFLEGKLPTLSHFILPGGSKMAAHLNFARSLTRKAERRVVNLSKKEKVDPAILIFLNRLSDLIFMLARNVNHELGMKEIIWTGKDK